MVQQQGKKAGARDEARAAAADARALEAVRAKRRRSAAIGGLVVAIGVLVVVVILVLSQEEKQIAFPGEPGSLTLQEVTAPAAANDDGGIPVGPGLVAGTESGSEAVVVDVLFDYRCPYCAVFEETVGPELTALAEAGTITLVYRPVSFLDERAAGSRQYSTRSATAAALVADRAPEHFVAFHEALMANQPGEGEGPSDEDIAQVARNAGVPEGVVEQLTETAAGTERTFARWIHAATARGDEILGGLTTPSVLIGGERWPGPDEDRGLVLDPAAVPAAIEARTS